MNALKQILMLLGFWKGKNPKDLFKDGAWRKRLPQILNQIKYELSKTPHSVQLEYDPFYLHIMPAESAAQAANRSAAVYSVEAGLPEQRFNLESFRFLLDQLPVVLAIEFSGQAHDPFENGELLEMVDYAYHFSGAESTVYTDGMSLLPWIDRILESRLHCLVINMVGPGPSSYALRSGKPLEQYVALFHHVEELLKRKKASASKVLVELRLTVDVHNYRDIPDLIRFAEDLGADGVCFDNYVSPDLNMKSDKTLYRHFTHIAKYLKELEQKLLPKKRIRVTLPKLMDTDMSSHRYCRDAFNMVSVDADCNVSACSRHLHDVDPMSTIWDEDFFNAPMYKTFRRIFGRAPAGMAVPLACQSCPRNLPL